MKKIKVRKRQGWKARHPGNYQWNKDINLVSHQAIYIGKGREGLGRSHRIFQTEVSASVKILRQKLEMFKELQRDQCDWK